MKVLGISFSNDAAAAIVSDEGVVAAVSEERFARVKHHAGWPAAAIEFCLARAGCALDDLDAVAFAWNPAVHLSAPLPRYRAWRHQSEYLAAVPNHILPQLTHLGDVNYVEQRFAFANRASPLPIYFVTHHLAHAASCFFVSPFDDAAILTFDGYGERTSTLFADGSGTTIRDIGRVEYPHSLGSLYAAVTAYLGFKPNNAEGKIMALASYGTPRLTADFRKLVRLLPGGRFELDLSYFDFYLERGRRVSPKFIEQFGPPRVAESGAPDSRHLDIATAVQTVFEETLDHLLAHTQRETNRDAICLAGGAALNCVANGRALPRSAFRDWYIQPAAGDNGAALGAALYVVHAIEKRPRRFVMRHDRLGPSFSDSEIAKEITLSGVPFERPKSIARATALLLSRGLIGSWFQGGAEFGPRSLGARSILADARDAAMIDKLNSRVKFREPFRPFAPAILAHRVGDYFSPNVPSPFMLFCHDVRTDRRHEVPAIVHVDGTARVQTVERDVNPLFYELIEAFDKETGVPLILNTSFNIRGEPIVNSLKDALKCYLTTDIDFLAIGGYLLWKPKPACVEAIAVVMDSVS